MSRLFDANHYGYDWRGISFDLPFVVEGNRRRCPAPHDCEAEADLNRDDGGQPPPNADNGTDHNHRDRTNSCGESCSRD